MVLSHVNSAAMLSSARLDIASGTKTIALIEIIIKYIIVDTFVCYNSCVMFAID